MAQKTIFELDLVGIARMHRKSVVLVLFVLLLFVGMMLTSANSIAIPEMISFAVMILYLISLLVSIVFVIILQQACGSSWLGASMYGLLTVFFTFLVVLVTISRAGTILRLAGAKPGFLGISKDE